MQFKRLRTIGALACGGGMIALALTGCNDNAGASGSSDSPPSSSGSATPEQSTSPTTPSTGRAPTMPAGQGNTPTCLAPDMHADLLIQHSNSADKGIGTLVLTNTGHRCLIPAGWAPIGTRGPHNYMPFPAKRTNYPGTGRSIVLSARRSVYAGMKWHTGTGCGTTDLGVAWGSSWIPIKYQGLNGHKPPICDSLVLGTIQPSMEGVNFT
ncbi:MAG: hypothetical protein JWP48_1692 [Actinoallomurus sp.]|nr:hypothetical protein [Actinoallomurus sp.]